MTSFLETPRFSSRISYGSAGGPGFNTTVFEGHGGVEQRGQNWATTKGKWNVAQGVRDNSDFAAIRALFMAVRGKAIGFRFKDWGDYQLVAAVCTPATANGTNPTFKLQKTYTSGSLSYVRRIFKPTYDADRTDGTDAFAIFDNGISIPLGAGASQVSLDFATGIMTFGASVIPAAGHVITATGEFDLPVRFDTDFLEANQEDFDQQTWSNIPLIELLLTDA